MFTGYLVHPHMEGGGNSALRQRHDIVIGLYIRRGDYREFFDGRFYYPWSSYAR